MSVSTRGVERRLPFLAGFGGTPGPGRLRRKATFMTSELMVSITMARRIAPASQRASSLCASFPASHMPPKTKAEGIVSMTSW